ncbi:DUF2842 domain-containing protein [Kordiimonas pumila]|uniref:DUF2842 domain-containing protein n=1 Tax=Kordiimonas pumila TaxID=2161677 RepID=A0ABV7D870_9PROT|nr:DUF2842 domain-containing protein [Kordiimonas pumila]
MDPRPQRPSSRSFFGMLAMIFGLGGYIFLAAFIGEFFITWPILLQSVYYLIAGLIWTYVAVKLLRWMAAGYKNKE